VERRPALRRRFFDGQLFILQYRQQRRDGCLTERPNAGANTFGKMLRRSAKRVERIVHRVGWSTKLTRHGSRSVPGPSSALGTLSVAPDTSW